ncbi:LpqN/LpqT family lipoprotein [Mycobacterium sp. SMC-4]|uniref:LpqN/LpqT family lipoprotein n=1 Tax=Mycobacterium sp. SMC-4 TaxID=2857059 RepID=UPI0021B39B53|nr:LpqN/LpqT family lipoprotein [Mycobacterium sp. SMC-4]UXA17133.1 LpqN/LpqT family lipoprotein [Mycobacterium sp. SMC-4]
MTRRIRLTSAAAALLLSAVACAPEAPDYQTIWSTTNTPAAATADPEAEADQERMSIAAWLERAGVVGQQVAPDKLTDITVSMPMPQGWQPYQNPNLSPGTRVIAQGSTYPMAMLMVFELDGDFNTTEALNHADVDAKASENFRELNASRNDFRGFPSSMIEGSYDLNGARMHSYNRIVIATGAAPQRQRYLVQFTVTGFADKAAEEAPDIEAIISGFTVEVPVGPPPP